MIIEIKITPAMIQLRNSITDGEGNLAGFVGEAMVSHFLRRPKPFYECSVAAYNTEQDCDGYLFTRVMRDLERGWLLGYMPKEEYYRTAVRYEKGDKDPQNNFNFKAACYNLRVDQLYGVARYDWDGAHV
jgi:hypothetical protein